MTNTNFKGFIGYHPLSPTTDTSWLVDSKYDTLETMPLDGIILTQETDSGANFTESMWSGSSLTIDDLSDMIERYETRNTLGWGDRIRYNWLAILTETTAIDWFDADIQTVVDNLSLAGRFIAETGLYGLWFDPENYNNYAWRYSTMPDKLNHTLAEYQTQVYTLAREIAANWLSYDPNFQFMPIKGYYFHYQYLEINGDNATNREANPYGLYKHFLDGIMDEFGESVTRNGAMEINNPSTGSNGNMILNIRKVSGNTLPAFTVEPVTYASLPRMIASSGSTYTCISTAGDQSCLDTNMPLLTGVRNSNYKGGSLYFDRYAQICPSLWVDYPGFDGASYSLPDYDPSTPNANYFTPANVKDSLRYIADRGEWVWLYFQKVRYVDPSVPRPLIPQAILDEMEDLRTEMGLP